MSRKPKLVPFNGSRREVIRLKTLQKHPCKEAKEMGGIICNILEIWSRTTNYEKCKQCVNVEHTDEINGLREELIAEMCNDIACSHPLMVEKINQIALRERRRKFRIPNSEIRIPKSEIRGEG